MAGEGLLRAQWNKVLLEDVAVPAYLRLLELSSAYMSPAHQMQLWPVKSSGGPWEWICTGVFNGSVDKNVLYSLCRRPNTGEPCHTAIEVLQILFDFAVNSGISTAVKSFQRVLQDTVGKTTFIDGKVGAETIK
jgi:hypothetical protein